ncbi:MAG: hypothetical protein H8E83_05920 [Planctomycetes bacterium]|nr:hypothetical protein [Planctomycetota bacterium]
MCALIIPHSAMVDGIDSIPVLGTPGTMAVWGEEAFPVVVGKNKSQPIAVAATYGHGRFFAIAHGSYVSGVKDGTAIPFMNQVAQWASQKESPRIGTLKNNTKNWDEVDLLMWGQNMQLSSENETKLLEWIEGGGGVIASACPWGWVQVTGKNLQNDLSQNRVMAKLGMQYGGNYAKGNGGEFQLGEIEPETNAGFALNKIASGEPCSPVGSGALQYAAQVSHSFRKKVNEVIQSDRLQGPSKQSPVKSNDVRRRLFVTNFSSEWKDLPANDVVAADGSEVFPGTVDKTILRGSEQLNLDSSVRGWQSTGLYLSPGEKLTLLVLEGDPNDWSIRIGCHKDKLWHKDSWTRWPEITHVLPLHNQMDVATPWGGLIYFVANKNAIDIDVSISGVVEAPLFDIDDTETDWFVERKNPAPWAEIKGHHMILSVPSSAVRELDNPEEVSNFWDKVVSSHCELAGVEIVARPERFVADQQISAGYMHSGYPIMTGVDVATPKKGKLARVVDVVDLTKRGSWGHFHELGHNRQRGWWTFAGTGEVTCNLFSLHAGEVLCGIEPWENGWLKRQRASAKKYLEEGSDFAKWKSSPGIALVSYAQLQKEFGWDSMTRVFKEYEAMPASQRPADNQAKMDEWVRRLSISTKHDLRPFYKMWGMPLSESLLNDTTLSRLPVWMAPQL